MGVRRGAGQELLPARGRQCSGDAYPMLDSKAATLLHSLARNHALVDGNERLALAGLIAFYGINGHRLTLTNNDAYELVVSIASGTCAMNTVRPSASRWRRRSSVGDGGPKADPHAGRGAGAAESAQAPPAKNRSESRTRSGRSTRCSLRGRPVSEYTRCAQLQIMRCVGPHRQG
ncbi:hypothetical protein Franean1_5415 [Parafrankia sp. EAN1pec]|nr:hypothetical protein Franean1_5415 [Frankia sp. EAN1pec]